MRTHKRPLQAPSVLELHVLFHFSSLFSFRSLLFLFISFSSSLSLSLLFHPHLPIFASINTSRPAQLITHRRRPQSIMKLSIILAGISALTVSTANVTTSASPCTTTLRTLIPFDLSPTTTVYATTKTAISKVNCGGCFLRIQNIGGIGPVRPEPTVTVSKRRTTETLTVCSRTPIPHAS